MRLLFLANRSPHLSMDSHPFLYNLASLGNLVNQDNLLYLVNLFNPDNRHCQVSQVSQDNQESQFNLVNLPYQDSLLNQASLLAQFNPQIHHRSLSPLVDSCLLSQLDQGVSQVDNFLLLYHHLSRDSQHSSQDNQTNNLDNLSNSPVSQFINNQVNQYSNQVSQFNSQDNQSSNLVSQFNSQDNLSSSQASQFINSQVSQFSNHHKEVLGPLSSCHQGRLQ
jgi:hypothetical protein